MGWARPKNFRVKLGWARPSPAQARKIRAGLSAHGPKILICSEKTNIIVFFVLRKIFFCLIKGFQIMSKLMMKLRQGNLTPLTISPFIILGPFGTAHKLGWAFQFWPSPAQARKSWPMRRPPIALN